MASNLIGMPNKKVTITLLIFWIPGMLNSQILDEGPYLLSHQTKWHPDKETEIIYHSPDSFSFVDKEYWRIVLDEIRTYNEKDSIVYHKIASTNHRPARHQISYHYHPKGPMAGYTRLKGYGFGSKSEIPYVSNIRALQAPLQIELPITTYDSIDWEDDLIMNSYFGEERMPDSALTLVYETVNTGEEFVSNWVHNYSEYNFFLDQGWVFSKRTTSKRHYVGVSRRDTLHYHYLLKSSYNTRGQLTEEIFIRNVFGTPGMDLTQYAYHPNHRLRKKIYTSTSYDLPNHWIHKRETTTEYDTLGFRQTESSYLWRAQEHMDIYDIRTFIFKGEAFMGGAYEGTLTAKELSTTVPILEALVQQIHDEYQVQKDLNTDSLLHEYRRKSYHRIGNLVFLDKEELYINPAIQSRNPKDSLIQNISDYGWQTIWQTSYQYDSSQFHLTIDSLPEDKKPQKQDPLIQYYFDDQGRLLEERGTEFYGYPQKEVPYIQRYEWLEKQNF